MVGVTFDFEPDPNWERLATVLRNEGELDRVPLFDLHADKPIMDAVVGREGPERWGAADLDASARFRCEFYHKAGYDFVAATSLFRFPRHPASERGAGPAGARSSATARSGEIPDRAAFETYPWPEVRDEHFRHVEATARYLPDGMKVRPRGPGGPFARVLRLMGFEGLSYALADDPDLIEQMFDAVGSRLVELIRGYARFDAVGAVVVGDDMGFKTQTTVRPEVLRRYVFPWHRRIVDAVHAAGKFAILHSCGNVLAVMDDIIECGWDAKHSFEDVIMPVAEVKRRWGDRIAILGGFDVDKLSRFTPRQVREHTRGLIRQCAPGGGWAVGSGNSVADYVPVENYVAMQNAAWEFGRYGA
ncbi:MAG: uroporphyrinogen decarboxylase family protein [bacterium]